MNLFALLISIICGGLAFWFYSTDQMFWVAWEIPCFLLTFSMFIISLSEEKEVERYV